jgi:hypothetical protein
MKTSNQMDRPVIKMFSTVKVGSVVAFYSEYLGFQSRPGTGYADSVLAIVVSPPR